MCLLSEYQHAFWYSGRVSFKILWTYIRALGGIWGFGLLMSWYLLVEAARIGTTVWLSYWTGVSGSPGGAPHKAMWYLGIYAIISGVQVSNSVLNRPHSS